MFSVNSILYCRPFTHNLNVIQASSRGRINCNNIKYAKYVGTHNITVYYDIDKEINRIHYKYVGPRIQKNEPIILYDPWKGCYINSHGLVIRPGSYLLDDNIDVNQITTYEVD